MNTLFLVIITIFWIFFAISSPFLIYFNYINIEYVSYILLLLLIVLNLWDKNSDIILSKLDKIEDRINYLKK